MPNKLTEVNLLVTWFAIRENPGGTESLDAPIAQETIIRRRAWTAERDLIAASNEQEVWRKPTTNEELDWGLCFPQEGDLSGESCWLVATTGEPGLGVPTRMAVRLQEFEPNSN